jgi:DNA-binding transcriptional LysR family regulator
MFKSNINLNLYKTFYEVAKYGSISEAAKQTFASQPAISKSIKKLEEELDVKLFYRTLTGVKLTDKGKELLFFVEQSFNNLVTAERNMLETNNLKRGKLSIGMPSNIGTFLLFDNVIDFHNKYPNIEITIVTGSTSKLINLLESHKVDFVIDTSPINIQNNDIVIDEIKTVNYSFIVNTKTKIENIDKIKNLSDLKDRQLILPIPGTSNRNDLDLLLLNNKVEIENTLNIHTSELIISAVKKDLGIGYVISNLIENDNEIKVLKLKEKMPKVTINLVYNPNYLTTAPIKFIKDYIKEINS